MCCFASLCALRTLHMPMSRVVASCISQMHSAADAAEHKNVPTRPLRKITFCGFLYQSDSNVIRVRGAVSLSRVASARLHERVFNAMFNPRRSLTLLDRNSSYPLGLQRWLICGLWTSSIPILVFQPCSLSPCWTDACVSNAVHYFMSLRSRPLHLVRTPRQRLAKSAFLAAGNNSSKGI